MRRRWRLVEERLDVPARDLMKVTRTASADWQTVPTVSYGLAELYARGRDLVVLLPAYRAAAARDLEIRTRYRRRQRAVRDALAEAVATRHECTSVPNDHVGEEPGHGDLGPRQRPFAALALEPYAVDPCLFGEIVSLIH
jgi:hypothetical protein